MKYSNQQCAMGENEQIDIEFKKLQCNKFE